MTERDGLPGRWLHDVQGQAEPRSTCVIWNGCVIICYVPVFLCIEHNCSSFRVWTINVLGHILYGLDQWKLLLPIERQCCISSQAACRFPRI